MNPLAGLKDIQGLDTISWWPLAPGWWLILGALLLSAIGIARLHLLRKRKQRSWRFAVTNRLRGMESGITAENAPALARELAGLLRRLAMQRYSRIECASLSGPAWLDWLSEHDAAKFNWREFPVALGDVAYRPPGVPADPEALKSAIRAAKGWVS